MPGIIESGREKDIALGVDGHSLSEKWYFFYWEKLRNSFGNLWLCFFFLAVSISISFSAPTTATRLFIVYTLAKLYDSTYLRARFLDENLNSTKKTTFLPGNKCRNFSTLHTHTRRRLSRWLMFFEFRRFKTTFEYEVSASFARSDDMDEFKSRLSWVYLYYLPRETSEASFVTSDYAPLRCLFRGGNATFWNHF